MQRKPIIGLAGGIGAGKSTVARLFGSLGARVIDADALARQAMDRPEVCEQLRVWWGAAVFDEHGQPDRRKIAWLVFGAPDQRKRLEGLIHPIVAAERERMIEAAREDPSVRAIVLDVPLLFEVGLDRLCDRIVFVHAERATRLRRVATQRGWDERDLADREKSQIPLDIKRSRAHNVVDGNASEAECLSQVRDVLNELLPSS